MSKAEEKIKLFVVEYLKDMNGTRAAIAAGYAPKSAHVTASKLLKNPKVEQMLAAKQGKRLEKLGITADKILEELAKLGFSNMLDYMSFGKDGDAHLDWSAMTRNQAAAIQEVTIDEYTDGTGEDAREVKKTKFKLADKRGALDLLGRHFRLFVDRVELSDTSVIVAKLVEGRRRAQALQS